MSYAGPKKKLHEIGRESLLPLLNQIKMQTCQIKVLSKQSNPIVGPLKACV